MDCNTGCGCKSGYVKDENNRCILPDQCPKGPAARQLPAPLVLVDAPKKPGVLLNQPQKKCGSNEEWKSCGSPCAPTCKTPEKPVVCVTMCITGCFCKEGFLKNAKDQCVPANQCAVEDPKPEKPAPPAAQPPQQTFQCGANEDWRNCGPSCTESCDNPGPLVCPKNCKRGCFCKSGHVRAYEGGPCIPSGKCSAQLQVPSTFQDLSTILPLLGLGQLRSDVIGNLIKQVQADASAKQVLNALPAGHQHAAINPAGQASGKIALQVSGSQRVSTSQSTQQLSQPPKSQDLSALLAILGAGQLPTDAITNLIKQLEVDDSAKQVLNAVPAGQQNVAINPAAAQVLAKLALQASGSQRITTSQSGQQVVQGGQGELPVDQALNLLKYLEPLRQASLASVSQKVSQPA